MRKFLHSSLVLALVLLGSPALAHDELLSTTPLADSTVEAGPIPVILSFGEAPMKLPFGQGNLIAVANAETGQQLGPACAKIEGNTLKTTLNLSGDGEYKVLWRVASADGHILTGDFKFKVVNHSYYSTERVGNQCFDENGIELDANKQEPLSKSIGITEKIFIGMLWALPFVLIGSFGGALVVRRRQATNR